MKFTVIGNGKTGNCVSRLLPKENCLAVFDSKNKPNLATLKQADASIVFVTSPVMMTLLPMLLEANRPLVCGTTNAQWPAYLSEYLVKADIPWIIGNNFSLGMNMAFYLTKTLNQHLSIFDNPEVGLQEIHHTSKLDSPSGTTKTLKSFFTSTTPYIRSERTGDNAGRHAVQISSPGETLQLIHTAKDRNIYARGAIFAASTLLWKSHLKGLVRFEDLFCAILRAKNEGKT